MKDDADFGPLASPPVKERPRVQSAARVIEILQEVARSSSAGISARDLSNKLGLPRQVVYHHTHTLVATGMLQKARGNAYVLGMGVAALAQGFRRQLAAQGSFGSYAELAASATGETAYIVGWVDDEIVVLGSARGKAAIQAAEVPRGTAGDAHARASGKLLLAMCPEEEVVRYLAAHPQQRRTANTLTSWDEFKKELERVRADWVAMEHEEYALGLACMAVPIGAAPSQLALGISAPVGRMEANREEYLVRLRAIAAGGPQQDG